VTVGKGGTRNHPLCQAKANAMIESANEPAIMSPKKIRRDERPDDAGSARDNDEGKSAASDIDIETVSSQKRMRDCRRSLKRENIPLIQI
jgi:hypothetical protein